MKLQLDNYQIEYELTSGAAPTVVFCPGFNSTMQGNKAQALKAFCVESGIAFIRFDYSGHGESGGEFADGCISTWLNDTLEVIDRITTSEVIVVGSSMGGWIALLVALRRPQRVKGLLLIACAADMTRYYPERLEGLVPKIDDKSRVFYSAPNEYDDQQPYSIYQHLIDDGSSYYLLEHAIELDIPVRLIHGEKDEVVDWQRSQQVLDCLTSSNASLLKVKTGDHRLSTEADLNSIRILLADLISIF